MKVNLFLLIAFICGNVYGQNSYHIYTPEGKEINTEGKKTLGDIYRSISPFYCQYIAKMNGKYNTVLYVPLTHKPLAVEAESPTEAAKCLVLFNQETYYGRGTFDSDFSRLRDSIGTKEKIISLLGAPSSIDTTEYAGGGSEELYYGKKFILKFTAGSLIDYSIINVKGATLNKFGLSDFHINLSESSSDYVTGFRVQVYNLSKKRIKYVHFTVNAINQVGDLVQAKTVRGIGPIEASETASFSFDDIFFSRIIDVIKVVAIKINYFDGTDKIIPKAEVKSLFIK